MTSTCSLRIARQDFDVLMDHLFPGDHDEHGAVLLAGVSRVGNRLNLHVREIHLAEEDVDYVQGTAGYRALTPRFIHRLITRARDERLVYLAAHNHLSDREVTFSPVDLASHERGYPALLQIAKGMPVGALVFGRRSVEADIWVPEGSRLSLDEAVVVGSTVQRLTASPRRQSSEDLAVYDRQVKMFGKAGQTELARCRVGIIGLGGIGSIVAEYLARLGIEDFCLVDSDKVETSNLSRIVGGSQADANAATRKVDVAARVIKEANPAARVELIDADAARQSAAKALAACDYLFLAADSMRARLVFNAIVHQYTIPGVQLGAKVRQGPDGTIIDAMSANRPVRPGRACLWCNQLIDPMHLATEAKTDQERKDQAYGVEEPNPSVISLNAIAASHAVNDFLFDYLSLRTENEMSYYEHFHHLNRGRSLVQPRKDAKCPECSRTGLRYGRGDMVELPCIEG